MVLFYLGMRFTVEKKRLALSVSIYEIGVNKCCTGNHASLVAILDVLSQVQQLAAAGLHGFKAGLLLDYVSID